MWTQRNPPSPTSCLGVGCGQEETGKAGKNVTRDILKKNVMSKSLLVPAGPLGPRSHFFSQSPGDFRHCSVTGNWFG